MHRFAFPVLWTVLLWLADLAVSHFVARSSLPLLAGFTDEELSDPGGLILLEAVRLNLDGALGSLAWGGQLTLTWLLGSLPLTFLVYRVSAKAGAQPAGPGDPLGLGGAPLPALLRFTALSLGQAVAEVLLVGLAGVGAYAALRSEHPLRIEAALLLVICWAWGRGLPAAYFDLARLAATSGGVTIRMAHSCARESLEGGIWRLWLTRALVAPAALGLGLCALLAIEHVLTRSSNAFIGGAASAELLLLAGQFAHTIWLLAAAATFQSRTVDPTPVAFQ